MVGVSTAAFRGLIWADDREIRYAVQVHMQLSGVRVLGAVRSPDEALQRVEADRPDVVVIDLALTGFSGLRAVTALFRVFPGCSVAVLASFPELKEAARAAGADALFTLRDLRPLRLWLQHLGKGHSRPCDCYTSPSLN